MLGDDLQQPGDAPLLFSREVVRRRVVATALAVAGVAHVLAVVDHRDSLVAGGFFVTAAVGQLALAVAVLRARQDRRLRLLVVAVTAALLGVWAASRTVGIAIGHAHGPEGVGVLDALAVAAEVVVLLLLVRAPRLAGWRYASVAAALSVAVLGTAAIAASRPTPPTTQEPGPAAHSHGACHEAGCESHAHP